MFWIGQKHIVAQLELLLKETYRTKKGTAILFRGASGFGKTELARKSANFLAGTKYEECLGDNVSFNPDVWVHFIDEIHTAPKFEPFYPIMDTNRYVLIFATNFDSNLPEAFTNRCQNFLFSNYSNEELRDIFRKNSFINVDDEVIDYIASLSGGVPRVMIKKYAETLEMLFYKSPAEFYKGAKNIIAIIDEMFMIKDGLDRTCRDYISAITTSGGKASIQLLSSLMRLDSNTIKYYIEPILIQKGLIKISSKGRELCQ